MSVAPSATACAIPVPSVMPASTRPCTEREGKAFSEASKLVKQVPVPFSDQALHAVADKAVHGLVDAGITEGTGIAQAIGVMATQPAAAEDADAMPEMGNLPVSSMKFELRPSAGMLACVVERRHSGRQGFAHETSRPMYLMPGNGSTAQYFAGAAWPVPEPIRTLNFAGNAGGRSMGLSSNT
eukprot:CAMPEP_0117492824 /NCGR_PEP_ID=MMETSP0784-20121206/18783_1 /TAXON_ID=39447 /ORGANISM="" /LENGTH=182 /DNA_ID=CAMNT_0005287661 /DNA_START=181 /DNA_END=725 /DNA_ORIENTATION=+